MLKLIQGTLLACALVPASAMAAIVIDAYEDNGNVVFEASGTFSLDGLADPQEIIIGEDPDFMMAESEQIVASIEPQSGSVFMIPDTDLPLTVHLYQSAATPGPFGIGGGALASDYIAGGSPFFGMLSDIDFHGIFLPTDFQSGSSFSQSMVFEGTTLAALGIEADASYLWSWSNGETVTLTVAGIVPEPSTYAAIIGATMLGLVGLRRFRQRV